MLVLDCLECNRSITLDPAQQERILRELERPSQAVVVECQCKLGQTILAARRVRSRVLNSRVPERIM
jgi:hypothetical protein